MIYLVLQLIIGPEHGLVHIYTGMKIDFSCFGIKIPLLYCSFRNQTGMSICLTLGVTVLASKTEIIILFYSQCTYVAPVWSDRSSMYLRMKSVF